MEDIKLPNMPELKVKKNGYEIRSDILAMANNLVAQEYTYKWQGWKITAIHDEKTGQLVNTVEMPPFPGLDKVLETAEKMYAFVTKQK